MTSSIISNFYNSVFCSKKSCPPPQMKSQKTVVIDEDLARQQKDQWFEAVHIKDVDHMQELIDCGVDVNILDENQWCALHLSAWNGLVDVCRALLLHPKCNVNGRGPSGSTALTLASQQGHSEIVSLLLQAKCDVNTTTDLDDCHGVTALHLAAKNGRVEIVEMLIKAGADIDGAMTSKGLSHITAMHLAVEEGHNTVLDILINAGSNVHTATKSRLESAC